MNLSSCTDFSFNFEVENSVPDFWTAEDCEFPGDDFISAKLSRFECVLACVQDDRCTHYSWHLFDKEILNDLEHKIADKKQFFEQKIHDHEVLVPEVELLKDEKIHLLNGEHLKHDKQDTIDVVPVIFVQKKSDNGGHEFDHILHPSKDLPKNVTDFVLEEVLEPKNFVKNVDHFFHRGKVIFKNATDELNAEIVVKNLTESVKSVHKNFLKRFDLIGNQIHSLMADLNPFKAGKRNSQCIDCKAPKDPYNYFGLTPPTNSTPTPVTPTTSPTSENPPTALPNNPSPPSVTPTYPSPPTATPTNPSPPTSISPPTVTPTYPSPATVTPTSPSPPTATPTSPSPATATPTSPSPATVTPTNPSPPTATPTNTSPATVTPTYPSPPTATPTNPTPLTATPTNTSPTTVTPTYPSPPTATPTNPTPLTATPTYQTPLTVTPTNLSPPTATPTNPSPPTATSTNPSLPTATPSHTPTPLPPFSELGLCKLKHNSGLTPKKAVKFVKKFCGFNCKRLNC